MTPPNMDAVMAVFDKLLPPQPDPDPARLALARMSAAAMWPEGAYGNMMTSFAGGMVDNVPAFMAEREPSVKLTVSLVG